MLFLVITTLRAVNVWGGELDQDDLVQKLMPPTSLGAQAHCPAAEPDAGQLVLNKHFPKDLRGQVMRKGIGRRKDWCLWAPGSFVPWSTGSLTPKHIFPPSSPIRAETLGHWPVSGDEHSLPLLVLLPPRSLQQKDVWGVQAAGSGGCQRRLQVSGIEVKALAGAWGRGEGSLLGLLPEL